MRRAGAPAGVSAATAAQRAALGQAFLQACALDVAVRKPGNVSHASAGHGMEAAQFLASAAAAAEFVAAPGARVGERIEGAVRASWQAAGCNTNLGIVLLCAPLLAAFERAAPAAGMAALRAAVATVLEDLDVADAGAAYRAIALAHPAGLGEAPEQDVQQVPTVNLREAMGLAAGRDRIAWQYAHGFADVFTLGVPAFLAAPDARVGMQAAFLAFLAATPDSHIVRKHGEAVAHCVMREAMPWHTRSRAGEDVDAAPAFAQWDEDLKARGLNPGTSADLSAATALAVRLGGASPRFP